MSHEQFDGTSSQAYVGSGRSTSGASHHCALMVRKVSVMDLQHRITEALEEHLAVIHQLAAVSDSILQVAGELVATLRHQGKVVLCGNGGVPAMPNISPQKCRVSAPILTRLTGCWHSP